MKIVSWNVNGIRARIDHIVAWIEENQPDVLADYFWKELEKDSENKQLYEAIAFYSQQAANYSTIYDVWCD